MASNLSKAKKLEIRRRRDPQREARRQANLTRMLQTVPLWKRPASLATRETPAPSSSRQSDDA